jgi:hypothetical protein
MDDVLISGVPPSVVKVRPGINLTSAGKVPVTLLEWAKLRVWGAAVWNVGGQMVKVIAASACR